MFYLGNHALNIFYIEIELKKIHIEKR